MPDLGQQQSTFRFGVFEFNPQTGELRKHGVKLKLQEQPVRILTLLLEHAGEAVTREDIQKRLWPTGTYVDFDNAINSGVRKLRDALGDSPENPRFIETLARRGYRFIAGLAARPGPAPAPKVRLSTVVARRRMGAIAAVMVFGLGIELAIWLARKNHTTIPADLHIVPFTTDPGLQIQPAFSPDGTRIAYAGNGPERNTFGIYVKVIGSGDPVRITDSTTPYLSPAWSPDGRRIAALRIAGGQAAVVLMSASGGRTIELTRLKGSLGSGSCIWPPLPILVYCGYPPSGSLLVWSSDGKYLFTSGSQESESPPVLVRVSVETGGQHPITTPSRKGVGDVGPALSPDGHTLAFIRATGSAAGEIYAVTLSDENLPLGQPRQVTFDSAMIDTPAWARNGRELIFASDREGRRALWRVLASGIARPARVAGAGDNAYGLAISPHGQHLAYGQRYESRNLWKTPIRAGKGGEPVRVTSTTKRDTWAHYSPDGRRIAFESDRSGVHEIWVCDADGSNAFRLTDFGKGWSGSPRWSPDGLTVAFDSNVEGSWDIYLIGAEGGRPIRLTKNPATDAIPTWSNDGHWIYFTSNRTGRHEIWKIRPDGSSEMQVTTDGGMVALESADAEYLYYKRNEGQSEIWKMPLRGGSASKVLDSAIGREFTVTERGLYFTVGNFAERDLRFLDFTSHLVRVISPPGDWFGGTFSSDSQWLLYSRREFLSMNLMLVENFL